MDILAMILEIAGVLFISIALILTAFKLSLISGIVTTGIVLMILPCVVYDIWSDNQ